MSRLRTVLTLGLIISLPSALGGCAGLLVIGGLGAAAGGGYVAAQERGVDGSINDFSIKMDIEKALQQTDPQLQAGVTTTAYGGRVLLTGRVPNEQMKMAAGQIAGRVANVRAVYNEVEVAPVGSMWDDTQDAWISARVRSEMVMDGAIRSVNYSVDTANGSVYLIGSARSQSELNRATQVARYVPGVKRVVSYVELRYGSPVATGPGSPAMSPRTSPEMNGGMAPGPAGAAPRAPIEVQKL